MLPWCIALSASVHVLLLTSAAPSTPTLGGLPRHVARRTLAPISVRLIPENRATTPAPVSMAQEEGATEPPTAPPAPEERAASPATSSPAFAASDEMRTPPQAVAATAAASASASTSRVATQDAGVSATGGSSGQGEESMDGYLPRPLLSAPPLPNAPVVIPTPPGSELVGRRVGVLALYIDDLGRVRRVEAEQPMLPPALERAAREAFLATRFTPGQVDGRAAKSRIRVEVVFDDPPLGESSSAAAGAGKAASAAQRSP